MEMESKFNTMSLDLKAELQQISMENAAAVKSTQEWVDAAEKTYNEAQQTLVKEYREASKMMNKNLQAYKELHHQVCHNQMIAASQFSHSQNQFSAIAQVMISMHQSLATNTKPAAIPADMIGILSKEYQPPPPPPGSLTCSCWILG